MLQVEVPERTHRQRMDALDEANRNRMARARLKRDVKAGRRSAVALLLADECPKEFRTMKVFVLMLSLPKVGRTKTEKMLRRAAISPAKTVGGLTPRQRVELASMLAPYDNGGGS